MRTGWRWCIHVEPAYPHAAITALTEDQSCVEAMLVAFRRAAIISNCRMILTVCCQAPSGAFYAFANIKNTAFSSLFQEKALENYA